LVHLWYGGQRRFFSSPSFTAVNSKQARINIQYCVETELDQASVRKDSENARNLVLELERAIENITIKKSKE
jgi:hypothetical protein